MKLVVIVLSVLVFLSGIRLLSSEGGVGEYLELKQRLSELEKQVEAQQVINQLLKKEVVELQSGQDAIETLARQRLGMIGQDEVFVQLLEVPPTDVIAPLPDSNVISIQENPQPINPVQP